MRGEVIVQGLRLRAGPGTTFGVLTYLNRGVVIEVLERQGDWLRISTGMVEGFVAAQYVNTNLENDVPGFLIERTELLEMGLVPDNLIPVEGLADADLVTARTWNAYGSLLARVADLLGFPVNAAVAVLAAESGGRAFSADGRLIVRFENHIFFRLWGEQNAALFWRHFTFDNTSPRTNWKGHQWRPNPESAWVSFHGSQKQEWDVLTFARTLDDTAALSSTSLGAPQIMGFNFKRIGYESVQAMYEAFARSAHAQLLAMFDVVKGPNATSPAILALQHQDYLTFASAYNGPANAQTYAGLIAERVAAFNRLIPGAVPRVPADSDARGPVEAGAPPPPAAPPPPPPADDPTNPPPVVVVPPPPLPPEVTLIATIEGVNVRSQPVMEPGNIIERLQQSEAVTLLDPLGEALDKIDEGEAGRKFLNVRTDEGRVGYVAAWLVTPSDQTVTRRLADEYINSIPDQFPIPDAYDIMHAMGDTLGLPDPFDMLPVQVRTRHKLVNMQVNGFGPNTFAARNWPRFYSRIGGMHNGYDFIIETGTPLLAVGDGVIIRRWPFMADPKDRSLVLWPFLPERFRDQQGRRLMSNLLVAYAHMSSNAVRNELDVVQAGEVIGISGTPGGSGTNDHLHLEIHFLSGNTAFRNLRRLAPRKLLQPFNRPQPYSNQTPWNPIWFFSRRIVRYLLHQGKTIGFGGQPAYPPLETLRLMGASHLPPLDEFTLAFYEYGIPVIWNNSGRPWPVGVTTTDTLPDVVKAFEPYQPYEAAFLK